MSMHGKPCLIPILVTLQQVRPSIHPSIWCRHALVPKRLGAESSRKINNGAEMSWCRNRQNAVVVVEVHSSTTKERCPSDYLALNLLG